MTVIFQFQTTWLVILISPPPEGGVVRERIFIGHNDFSDLYFGQNKRDLWNAIFDVKQFESERMQLAFGMKTDSHMISILLEKTALNFVPENKKEITLQKTRKNLGNWRKGLYPLYKNPYGITAEDRFIGIDPGMYI